MCYVYCRNKQTGEKFEKGFASPYFARQWLKKRKYFKNIEVLSWDSIIDE